MLSACSSRFTINIGIILICKLLAYIQVAQAESTIGQPSLSPTLIEKIASDLGVPKNSKFYKNFLLLTNPSLQKHEFVSPVLELEKKRNKNLLRHIRSTKGIPFPKEKQDKVPSYTPKGSTNSAHKKWRDQLLARNTQPKLIPSCTKDLSEKTPSKFTGSKLQEETVLFDMLFIRKEYAPLDPEEVLGKRTMVIPYSSDKATIASVAASGIKIPCLPYRVRGTAKFLIKDQGNNALKNYDKDPNGDGSMHEIMKRKLQSQG